MVSRPVANRPLIPRRYPRLLLHGPVDVPGLPVRRPWWMLAARHATLRLGRLHRAPLPPGASSAVAPPLASPAAPSGFAHSVVPEPVHRVPLARRPAPVPSLTARVPARAHPVRTVRRVPLSTVDSLSRDGTRRDGVRRDGVPAPAPLTGRRTVPEPVRAGRVDELPVLGGAPVGVPDGGFDASAAVRLPPAPPSPVAPVPAPATRMRPPTPGPAVRRDRTGAGAAQRTGRPGARPGSLTAQRSAAPTPVPPAGPVRGADAPVRSPEARWRAAVRARPLESPRTFPSALRPLVASLAGGAQRATYTTGPATRHALASAGALGASTGSVVHLPSAPVAGPGPLLGVIAHELAHARAPVSRPRFLLGVPHGVADAEERAAQAVGQRVQAAGDAVAGMGAGIVGDLPVGGLGRMLPNPPQVPDIDSAIHHAVGGHLPELPRLPGLPDVHLPDVHVPQALEQAGGAVTHAAAALTDNALTGKAGAALGGLDIDHLAEVLEQRVLRQIERRGGRYSGMF